MSGPAVVPTALPQEASRLPLDSLEAWDAIGFKVVAKVGPRYFSIWAGDQAEFILNVPRRERAQAGHRGGLYVCTTQEGAARHRIPVRRGGLYIAPRVMLRCSCEGPFVQYSGGKIACTAITPLEELPLPEGYLHSAPRRPPSQTLQGRPVRSTELLPGGRSRSGDPAIRLETDALAAEVAEMERRLGYRD